MNKKNKDVRIHAKSFFIALIIVITVLCATTVLSDPPSPQNVNGRVYLSAGVGAPNGVIVKINNTNLNQIFYTQVSAPPTPQLAGSYSATINASGGDYIYAWAYNDTNYGESSATSVSGSSTTINITMNLTRPAEANITITAPAENTTYNSGDTFNLTVNMSVLGNNGLNCNVTIFITNDTIMNVTENISNSVGNINLGQIIETKFEIISLSSGSVNITASGICQNNGVNFEGLNSETLHNLTGADAIPPAISIIAPTNNTENKSNNTIIFSYNVSDTSPIINCSLLINGTINQTNTSVQKNNLQTFTQNLSNSNYNWSIQCYDSALNKGENKTYLLNVSVYYPIIISATADQNIMLNPGGYKSVDCNFTVMDGNGATDIAEVNASIYREYLAFGASDDDNNHYTNSSCSQTQSSGNEANYTCNFQLNYFAENGTWFCNSTATDLSYLQKTNFTNTSVQPLYALNVSSLIVDYGDVAAGNYSLEKTMNITNLGNNPLNITVLGYGGNNSVTGSGYAFLCDSGENITIDNERYAISQSIPFSSKTALTSTDTDIGFTIEKQTIPFIDKMNQTYWQMFAPPMSITNCQGIIRFTVQAP